MRKALIILAVLLSVFLAIGCTGTKTNQTQAVTPTETPAATPVVEKTSVAAETLTEAETYTETETPALNETPATNMTEEQNVTGNETQVKRVSRTAQKLAAIKAGISGNKTSGGGAVNVTPSGGY